MRIATIAVISAGHDAACVLAGVDCLEVSLFEGLHVKWLLMQISLTHGGDLLSVIVDSSGQEAGLNSKVNAQLFVVGYGSIVWF